MMKGRRGGLWLSRVLWVATLLFWLPSAVRAENLGPGGGTRIITGDEVVGPYRLLVTAAPEPAQVGRVTFVVRISDPVSADKVRDAQVSLILRNETAGTELTAEMTHQNAGNLLDYAAHMTLEQPGLWNGVVTVTGPAGLSEVSFVQRVLPARQLSTVLIIGMPFLVLLGALGLFWFARSGSRRADQS